MIGEVELSFRWLTLELTEEAILDGGVVDQKDKCKDKNKDKDR